MICENFHSPFGRRRITRSALPVPLSGFAPVALTTFASKEPHSTAKSPATASVVHSGPYFNRCRLALRAKNVPRVRCRRSSAEGWAVFGPFFCEHHTNGRFDGRPSCFRSLSPTNESTPHDPGGSRTRDLRIKSPLLYQLSYRV
jgi:hypothetical protein